MSMAHGLELRVLERVQFVELRISFRIGIHEAFATVQCTQARGNSFAFR